MKLKMERCPLFLLGKRQKKFIRMKYKFDSCGEFNTPMLASGLLIYTSQFKKDCRKLINQNVINEIDTIINRLLNGEKLS